MLKQVPFYNLDILKIGDFTISLSALVLIVLLYIFVFFKDKNQYVKKLLYFTYFIIIAGVTKVFIFQEGNTLPVEIDSYSKIAFYFYNLMHYPLNSMVTYFMVYSHVMVITFIPFYFIFSSKRLFVIVILSINILSCLFNVMGIANQQFSFYNIILASLGFLIGYALIKITSKD